MDYIFELSLESGRLYEDEGKGQEEIAEIVQAYGHAARRIDEAGLDAIEIHAGHGYLIEQFLSPFSNHRSDRYGGDLDGRMRLLLEVIGEVRRNV
ncbi:MAG: hypothetical protein IH795_07545, partial [Bacteroidetes bacterium]|nr:hypothetical protein [Bacteroidota bacterium]